MKNSVVITVPSHPKYLSIVRSVTAGMGELNGLTASEVEDIKLAVDEACSNVIKYAYNGDTSKKVVVKFRVTKNKFEVIIEDNGKTHPDRIEGRKLNDVRPGGLGVHLIKRAFDVVAFDERKKKGNRLRLSRNRRYIKESNEDRNGRL